MKKILILIIISISFGVKSQGIAERTPQYVAFDIPVTTYSNKPKILAASNPENCVLSQSTKITVLGLGHHDKSYQYYVKSEKCEGYTRAINFVQTAEFKTQNKIAEEKVKVIMAPVIKERVEKENKIFRANQEKKKLEDEILKSTAKTKDSLTKKTCFYTINEVDVFDNVKIIRTSANWLAEGLYITLYAKGNQKKVVFSAIDLGCTSPHKNNRSWVKVMLENNDVLTFYHSGKLECGSFELWGNISNSEINRLKKSPLKAIKMEGTEYNHSITDFDWPTFFIDQLKCYEPN